MSLIVNVLVGLIVLMVLAVIARCILDDEFEETDDE